MIYPKSLKECFSSEFRKPVGLTLVSAVAVPLIVGQGIRYLSQTLFKRSFAYPLWAHIPVGIATALYVAKKLFPKEPSPSQSPKAAPPPPKPLAPVFNLGCGTLVTQIHKRGGDASGKLKELEKALEEKVEWDSLSRQEKNRNAREIGGGTAFEKEGAITSKISDAMELLVHALSLEEGCAETEKFTKCLQEEIKEAFEWHWVLKHFEKSYCFCSRGGAEEAFIVQHETDDSQLFFMRMRMEESPAINKEFQDLATALAEKGVVMTLSNEEDFMTKGTIKRKDIGKLYRFLVEEKNFVCALNGKLADYFSSWEGAEIKFVLLRPGHYLLEVPPTLKRDLNKVYSIHRILHDVHNYKLGFGEKKYPILDQAYITSFDQNCRLDGLQTVRKFLDFFKALDHMKESLQELFEGKEEQITFKYGSKTVNQAFTTQLMDQEEREFVRLCSISKAVAKRLKDKQTDQLLLIPTMSLETRSDTVMRTLEYGTFFLGLKALSGKHKIFIKETRKNGELHRSNISLDHVVPLTTYFSVLKTVPNWESIFVSAQTPYPDSQATDPDSDRYQPLLEQTYLNMGQPIFENYSKKVQTDLNAFGESNNLRIGIIQFTSRTLNGLEEAKEICLKKALRQGTSPGKQAWKAPQVKPRAEIQQDLGVKEMNNQQKVSQLFTLFRDTNFYKKYVPANESPPTQTEVVNGIESVSLPWIFWRSCQEFESHFSSHFARRDSPSQFLEGAHEDLERLVYALRFTPVTESQQEKLFLTITGRISANAQGRLGTNDWNVCDQGTKTKVEELANYVSGTKEEEDGWLFASKKQAFANFMNLYQTHLSSTGEIADIQAYIVSGLRAFGLGFNSTGEVTRNMGGHIQIVDNIDHKVIAQGFMYSLRSYEDLFKPALNYYKEKLQDLKREDTDPEKFLFDLMPKYDRSSGRFNTEFQEKVNKYRDLTMCTTRWDLLEQDLPILVLQYLFDKNFLTGVSRKMQDQTHWDIYQKFLLATQRKGHPHLKGKGDYAEEVISTLATPYGTIGLGRYQFN